MPIQLDASNMTDLESWFVFDAVKIGQISTKANIVGDFEKAMARYLGVEETFAVNSGTSALHLALMDCGIGSGDEVIIPALTFKATENVVRYVGAIPIIVDVDFETWTLDFDKVREAITSRTRVIIPVLLYGNPYYYKKIIDPSIIIIADATESLGAKLRDVPVERHDPYVCISFNGNKIITTGGGGLLICRNYGSIRAKITPDGYSGIGYNYGMTGLSAALGLAQIKRLDEFLTKKRMFNETYREKLNGLVKFQEASPDSEPSWWSTACLFPEDIGIEDLQSKLKEKAIPTGRIFKPLADLLNARYIYEHGLCLPSSTLNSKEDILAVCKVIKEMI